MMKTGRLANVLASGAAGVTLAAALHGGAQAQTAAAPPLTQEAATPTGAETPRSGANVSRDAQSADAGSNEVVVTGSRIKQDPNNSALPLQIITQQEISRNGISSPEQLIQFLTANGTGANNLASNSDVTSGAQRGVNGASFADLRGQGPDATLVLLNGRRVAAHGLSGSAVDVNQIPFAAIERVEVLKDGASAIYGTDAVAGVINFITRKDFKGFDLQAFADVDQTVDAPIYRVSGVGGYGDLDKQHFNIMGAVSYDHADPLFGRERDFVNTFQSNRGLSVDTRGTPFGTIVPFAGTIFPNAASPNIPFVPGTTTRASAGINLLNLPGAAGCGAIDGQAAYDYKLWSNPNAALACAWDTGRAAELQQALDTVTYLGRGVARFGRHELTVEVTGSRATADKVFSNLQLTPNAATRNYSYKLVPGVNDATYNAVFDDLVAAFPQLAALRGQPLGYRWRCIECGAREITTDTNTFRAVAGLDGPLFAGWDYRAGVSYAQSESSSQLGGGYYYTDQLVSALNSGTVNPFLFPGQTQNAAGLAAIKAASARGVTLYGGKYSVTEADASVSGSLFRLPAGEVKLAAGVDFRREEYRFNGAVNTNFDNILAAPGDQGNDLPFARRDIKAVYGEVLIPILKNLEVSAAGRLDDYGDFGTTTNPKVSIKYRPIQPILFRASYSTAFRVPTFNQLFDGASPAPYDGADIADPSKCPGGKATATIPACAAVTPIINGGGNPNLTPETATDYSAGVVYQPNRHFAVSLDWWRIDRQNEIEVPDLQTLVSNYALFKNNFIFDGSGNLTQIDVSYANEGASITSGLDLTLTGNFELFGGTVGFGIDGTYLLQREEKLTPGTPYLNQRGVFTFGNDLGLLWKHNAFVSYTKDKYNVSLTQIFRSGYRNQVLPGVADGTVNPPDDISRVDDYIIYNLSINYKLTHNLQMTFGVKNLLDTDPPFAVAYDSDTGGGSSWEPRVADPRGRSFTLNLEAKF